MTGHCAGLGYRKSNRAFSFFVWPSSKKYAALFTSVEQRALPTGGALDITPVFACMKTFYRCLLGLFGVLFLTPAAWATHVRAGEITVRRISETALTYEITLTLYCDTESGLPATQNTASAGVQFCFGDGNCSSTSVLPVRPPGNPTGIVNIGNGTARLTFVTTHTFNAPGTYTIFTNIDNRNDGTLNIPNSVNRSFSVESTVVINSSLGLNSSPLLLNPPVDFTACRGQRYIHNPNAFDPEGDSLGYRLAISKYKPQGSALALRPLNIPGFVQPDAVPVCAGQNETSSGPATFSINPRTGDVVWDAPNCVGQVNIAFIIEEWRRNANGTYSRISETTRDMQIIIRDCQNRRPTIEVPPDVCVEAGQVVNLSVRATDPDNNRLTISSNSSLYGPTANNPALIDPAFATFTTPAQPQTTLPATGLFTWQTNCDHVRAAPYEVLFKVEDSPGNANQRLVDSKIVRVRVVAPRPQNLTATANAAGRSITLNWAPYACAGTDVDMVIYRREGCGGTPPDVCASTGVPPGYREVGRVPSSATTFTDTTALRAGISYSYVIQGLFEGNLIARSAYSLATCASLPRQLPFLTNVTVDRTDVTAGEITVKWTRPLALNTAQVPGPYEYRLFRATGLNGTAYAEVTRRSSLTDTTFTDRNLNTEVNAYRYRLDFYYTVNGNLTRLDSTESGSSVRLTAGPAVRGVDLTWVASTPWNNQNQRHRVYRQIAPGVFNQIAEVAVTDPTTFRYTDDGTDRFAADGNTSFTPSVDSVYCYRVETVGTYGIPQFPYLLNNFSQVSCASPRDTTRPCPPALTVDLLDCATYVNGPCEEPPYRNTLTWTDPARNAQGAACDTRLAYYRIYYKRYSEDETFTRIDSVPVNAAPPRTYLHDELTSYAGCYYVTAVNRSGVESLPSNTVCKDNCPDYQLPNVFTPNNDGKNDTFVPMNCPRFVKSVEFKVYNRWGGLVYEARDSEGPNNILLGWDGKTNGGRDLAAGTYYYEARVVFERVSRADERAVVIKGWVQLLR
jgi:gliding motility-associated-like protein